MIFRQKMIRFHYYLKVLVIGIGNKDVTPDALGPKVVNNLAINRHLFKYHPELLDNS